MRTNKSVVVLLALIAPLGFSALSRAADQTLYVPLVHAIAGEPTVFPDGTYAGWIWDVQYQIFNNGASTATYTPAAVYGKGSVGFTSLCQGGSIAPHAGLVLGVCAFFPPASGVGFLSVKTTGDVVFHGDVRRNYVLCGCAGTFNCVSLPQGQASLPLYRGLFPAGSVAVSGAVELGQFFIPPTCASDDQKYLRRVNVTLFNAGDVPATFTITVVPVWGGTNTPFSTQTVTVDAKDVLQMNRVSVPTSSSNDVNAGDGSNKVWVTVTADQPFLSYVSTVFDNPGPGALPFQVYQSYLSN